MNTGSGVVAPKALQRITTQYDENEDRIRLAGEGEAGETMIIWLTHRLLKRLLPVLFNWLQEAESATLRPDIILSFAQAAAQADLKPQVPVEHNAHSVTWLVDRVDIGYSKEVVQLDFHDVAKVNCGRLTLAPTPLRQWLSIVYEQFLRGEWPVDGWPEWMHEARQTKSLAVDLLN